MMQEYSLHMLIHWCILATFLFFFKKRKKTPTRRIHLLTRAAGQRRKTNSNLSGLWQAVHGPSTFNFTEMFLRPRFLKRQVKRHFRDSFLFFLGRKVTAHTVHVVIACWWSDSGSEIETEWAKDRKSAAEVNCTSCGSCWSLCSLLRQPSSSLTGSLPSAWLPIFIYSV